MSSSQTLNPFTGRWCMDCYQCGTIRGVTRIYCPYNYCPPAQLCRECAKSTGYRRKSSPIHTNCH